MYNDMKYRIIIIMEYVDCARSLMKPFNTCLQGVRAWQEASILIGTTMP